MSVNNSPNVLVKIAAVMIIITLGVYWSIYLKSILVTLIVAFLLSILVMPITTELEAKIKSRSFAIISTIILFLGLICGTLYFVGLQLIDILDIWPELQKRTVTLFEEIEKWVKVSLPGGRKWAGAHDLAEVPLQFISDNGASMLLSATSLVAEMALIPLYMFFILYYRHFFRKVLYQFLGKSEETRVNHILYRVYDVIHNYLSGIFIVMVIVGTLNTMSLVLLSIPYAIFFGFLAAFLLLIPYIGIMIGALLPIIMALITKDSAMYGVGVAVAFSLIQFLEGNFITPYIVGSKISINPLMSIIALLIGALIWGVAGMALALPLVAIIKVICDHFTSLKPIGYLLGDPFDQHINEAVAILGNEELDSKDIAVKE